MSFVVGELLIDTNSSCAKERKRVTESPWAYYHIRVASPPPVQVRLMQPSC